MRKTATAFRNALGIVLLAVYNFVVRRAETTTLGTTVTGGTYYIQTTPSAADIQKGVAGTITSTQNARGAASTLTRRDVTGTAVGTPAVYPQVAAYMRRFLTRMIDRRLVDVVADESGVAEGLGHQQRRGSMAASHVGDTRARAQFLHDPLQRRQPVGDQMRLI